MFSYSVNIRKISVWHFVLVLLIILVLYLALRIDSSEGEDDRRGAGSTNAERIERPEKSGRSISRRSSSREATRSDRDVSEPTFVTADHPAVKTVIKLVQEFERKRTEVTFNSDINGRRKVFMDIAEPSDAELGRIRDAVAEISDLRKMRDGEDVSWSEFLTEQFFLETPTSYAVMIGATKDETLLRYTISPTVDGSRLSAIRGSVETADLDKEDVTWRFSHLISFGPEEVSDTREAE